MQTSNRWIAATRQLRLMLGLLTAAVMTAGLAGCGGSEDTLALAITDASGNPVAVQINTAAQIAQVSDDDYDNNLNGLITGATLKRWKDNWLPSVPQVLPGSW